MYISIAIVILSVIVTCSIIWDYEKLKLRFKVILGLFIISGSIALLYQQQQEQEKEKEYKSSIEQRIGYGVNELSRAIRAAKPEDKPDNLLDKFSKETPTRFLDMNYQRLKGLLGTDDVIGKQYLTIYFEEVEKIPIFYTWEEWKSTEIVLFKHILNDFQGHFISRNTYGDNIKEGIEKEFIQERDKCIKAKEREFNK